MSKAPMNWADDDGSSDEGSVDNDQPVTRQRKPSEDRSQEPRQQAHSDSHSSSAHSGNQHRQQNTKLPNHPPYCAFVGNLDYSVTRDILGSFFHEGGCNVQDVQILMKDGRSRGTAIVEFNDRESLERSLGAHETELIKRRISVGVSDRAQRGGDRNRGGRGDSRGGGDRRNDRGDRGGGGKGGGGNNYNRGGDDGGWNRGETRSRGNHKTSPRGGAPPLPTPSLQPGVVGTSSSSTSSSASSSAPPTRKKLELKPRQAPLDTIGERSTVSSSIFGEGKAREEVTPTAASSLNKEVKSLTIDSDKANTDNAEASKTSAGLANKDNKTGAGGDDDRKKTKDHQKTPKEKDSVKKDRNTPRGDKKNDNNKDANRKGGDNRNKGNTPKSQERRTPTGGGDNKSKKVSKAEKEKEKDKDTSEESAEARFLAANEKLKPQAAAVTKPKKVNAFSALMDDDSDSDGSS